MHISLLLLNLIWFSYEAKITFDRPCPDVKAIGNFDFARYSQGTWYELSRYPNDWQEDEDCPILKFEKKDDIIIFKSIGVSHRKNQTVEGILDIAENAGTTGVVVLKSNSFVEKEDENILPYHILDTDYETYAICYECKYDEALKKRQDYAWIDSRTMEFDSETRKIVDDFINASDILDEKYFIWGNFTEESCTANE